MKILVAADGSPFTKRMLAYLAAHDEWLGAHHAYTRAHRRAAGAGARRSVLSKDVLSGYYSDEGGEGLQADPRVLRQAGTQPSSLPSTAPLARRSRRSPTRAARPGGARLAWPRRPGHAGHGLGRHQGGGQCGVPVLLVR